MRQASFYEFDPLPEREMFDFIVPREQLHIHRRPIGWVEEAKRGRVEDDYKSLSNMKN